MILYVDIIVLNRFRISGHTLLACLLACCILHSAVENSSTWSTERIPPLLLTRKLMIADVRVSRPAELSDAGLATLSFYCEDNELSNYSTPAA